MSVQTSKPPAKTLRPGSRGRKAAHEQKRRNGNDAEIPRFCRGDGRDRGGRPISRPRDGKAPPFLHYRTMDSEKKRQCREMAAIFCAQSAYIGRWKYMSFSACPNFPTCLQRP
jgi:hypothetical protein